MDAETLSTVILLGSFLLMVFLRFPIAYSVGISTILCLISMGKDLSILPMQMVRAGRNPDRSRNVVGSFFHHHWRPDGIGGYL